MPIYEKDYLMEVSLKIEFAQSLDLEKEDGSKNFEKIFRERFPVSAFENNYFEDGEYKGKVWIYQERDKQIQLNDSFLELIYTKGGYKDKEELFEDVNLITEALNENEVEEAKYIGLRFINEIIPKDDGEIENLDEWINPLLINNNLKISDSQLIRGMSKNEYLIDDYFLNFQFGQYNFNYPNSFIIDNFILDYECYIKWEDTRYLNKSVKKMHEIINEFFEKSIGAELRKKYGFDKMNDKLNFKNNTESQYLKDKNKPLVKSNKYKNGKPHIIKKIYTY